MVQGYISSAFPYDFEQVSAYWLDYIWNRTLLYFLVKN